MNSSRLDLCEQLIRRALQCVLEPIQHLKGGIRRSVFEALQITPVNLRLFGQLLLRQFTLISKPRVPVMMSVGGKFDKIAGELIGATNGSFGLVPAKYPSPAGR